MRNNETTQPTPAQRFNVVGSSGSGKSVFSRRLASLLKIQHIEMDAVFWGPNWHWPRDEEFFVKLENELEKECWVLDGNYTRTIPIKWKRVQTVVWLDYSFSRTLFQSFKRAVTRAWTKEELWAGTGNRESFRKSFLSKDSIILWSIKNYRKVKNKYRSMIKDERFYYIDFVRLTSPKDASTYLKSVELRIKSREATRYARASS